LEKTCFNLITTFGRVNKASGFFSFFQFFCQSVMTSPIRLTKLAKRAGCAARQPPGYLFSRPERSAIRQLRARSKGDGTLPKRSTK
jgi:hypothetical protein